MLLKSIGLATAGLLIAAMPATAGATAQAARTRINVGDDYFRPAVKTVSRGTRVIWLNVGDDPHTVTTRRWSKNLNPGDRYVRTVKRGFRYRCIYHDGMNGRVIVG
jgi:plastocyanin